MSATESLEWLKKSLCKENEGFYKNLNNYQRLLNDLSPVFEKMDFLWKVNKQLNIMKTSNIEQTLNKNKLAIKNFSALQNC